MSSVREFLDDVVPAIKGEWHSRTTYGKLWFPAWFLLTALNFTLLWAFFTAAGWLKHSVEGIEQSSDPMFEVYEDDE